MTGGIAAVQMRMTELRALVAPTTVLATTTASPATTAAGTSTTTTASGTDFAAALAALGIDASAVSGLTGTGATVGSTSATSTTSGATGQGLVAAASAYVGVPYVWGGESLAEGGLDCSGLVQRALADIGVTGVPRVARDQMTLGTAVPSLDQALPGDLLVFDGGSHIAIYVGDGSMIDAPKPGKSVAIRDVYTEPTAIRRIVPQASAVGTTTAASAQLSAALDSATAQRAALDLVAGFTSSTSTSSSSAGSTWALGLAS